MKKLLKISILVLGLFVCIHPATAQSKTRVYVDCTCDDPVGSEVAMKLRDAIAASPRYQLASANTFKDQNGKEFNNWAISIVSMDPDKEPALQGHQTVMSVVITIGGSLYFDQSVRTCGSAIVSDCADRLLAFLDKDVHP